MREFIFYIYVENNLRRHTHTRTTKTMTAATASTNNSIIASCLLTVSNYPALFKHEEGLSSSSSSTNITTAFDVPTWLAYLEDIDNVLDIMNDYITTTTTTSHNTRQHGDGNTKKKKKSVAITAKTTTIEGGGRIFHISDIAAPGITHDNKSFIKEIQELNKVRIIVGERALSVLPGSYKIWKNHLSFYSTLIDDNILIMKKEEGRGVGNNNVGDDVLENNNNTTNKKYYNSMQQLLTSAQVEILNDNQPTVLHSVDAMAVVDLVIACDGGVAVWLVTW